MGGDHNRIIRERIVTRIIRIFEECMRLQNVLGVPIQAGSLGEHAEMSEVR
jgi:hypothetical protein